jgi:hypothetical protein
MPFTPEQFAKARDEAFYGKGKSSSTSMGGIKMSDFLDTPVAELPAERIREVDASKLTFLNKSQKAPADLKAVNLGPRKNMLPGGEFYRSASNPEEMYATEESRTDITDKMKKDIRMGLPGNKVNVEHITEVSSGGTSKPYNLQALGVLKHDVKTTVGSAADKIFELYNRKDEKGNYVYRQSMEQAIGHPISQAEILNMKINWDDKDTSGLVKAIGSQHITEKGTDEDDLRAAIDKYKLWTGAVQPKSSGLPTWAELKKVAVGVASGVPVLNWLVPEKLRRETQDEMGKAMETWAESKTGLAKTGAHLYKGVMSGVSLGNLPDYNVPDDEMADRIPSFVGNIAGSLVPMFAINVGIVGAASKLAPSLKIGSTAYKIASSLSPAAKAGAGAAVAAKNLPEAVRVAEATKGILSLVSTAKPGVLSQMAANFARNAPLTMSTFAVMGQMSRQEEEGVKARGIRLAYDLGMGAMQSAVPQGITKSLAPMWIVNTAVDYMMFDDLEGAMLNATVNTVFQAAGGSEKHFTKYESLLKREGTALRSKYAGEQFEAPKSAAEAKAQAGKAMAGLQESLRNREITADQYVKDAQKIRFTEQVDSVMALPENEREQYLKEYLPEMFKAIDSEARYARQAIEAKDAAVTETLLKDEISSRTESSSSRTGEAVAERATEAVESSHEANMPESPNSRQAKETGALVPGERKGDFELAGNAKAVLVPEVKVETDVPADLTSEQSSTNYAVEVVQNGRRVQLGALPPEKSREISANLEKRGINPKSAVRVSNLRVREVKGKGKSRNEVTFDFTGRNLSAVTGIPEAAGATVRVAPPESRPLAGRVEAEPTSTTVEAQPVDKVTKKLSEKRREAERTVAVPDDTSKTGETEQPLPTQEQVAAAEKSVEEDGLRAIETEPADGAKETVLPKTGETEETTEGDVEMNSVDVAPEATASMDDGRVMVAASREELVRKARNSFSMKKRTARLKDKEAVYGRGFSEYFLASLDDAQLSEAYESVKNGFNRISSESGRKAAGEKTKGFLKASETANFGRSAGSLLSELTARVKAAGDDSEAGRILKPLIDDIRAVAVKESVKNSDNPAFIDTLGDISDDPLNPTDMEVRLAAVLTSEIEVRKAKAKAKEEAKRKAINPDEFGEQKGEPSNLGKSESVMVNETRSLPAPDSVRRSIMSDLRSVIDGMEIGEDENPVTYRRRLQSSARKVADEAAKAYFSYRRDRNVMVGGADKIYGSQANRVVSGKTVYEALQIEAELNARHELEMEGIAKPDAGQVAAKVKEMGWLEGFPTAEEIYAMADEYSKREAPMAAEELKLSQVNPKEVDYSSDYDSKLKSLSETTYDTPDELARAFEFYFPDATPTTHREFRNYVRSRNLQKAYGLSSFLGKIVNGDIDPQRFFGPERDGVEGSNSSYFDQYVRTEMNPYFTGAVSAIEEGFGTPLTFGDPGASEATGRKQVIVSGEEGTKAVVLPERTEVDGLKWIRTREEMALDAILKGEAVLTKGELDLEEVIKEMEKKKGAKAEVNGQSSVSDGPVQLPSETLKEVLKNKAIMDEAKRVQGDDFVERAESLLTEQPEGGAKGEGSGLLENVMKKWGRRQAKVDVIKIDGEPLNNRQVISTIASMRLRSGKKNMSDAEAATFTKVLANAFSDATGKSLVGLDDLNTASLEDGMRTMDRELPFAEGSFEYEARKIGVENLLDPYYPLKAKDPAVLSKLRELRDRMQEMDDVLRPEKNGVKEKTVEKVWRQATSASNRSGRQSDALLDNVIKEVELKNSVIGQWLDEIATDEERGALARYFRTGAWNELPERLLGALADAESVLQDTYGNREGYTPRWKDPKTHVGTTDVDLTVRERMIGIGDKGISPKVPETTSSPNSFTDGDLPYLAYGLDPVSAAKRSERLKKYEEEAGLSGKRLKLDEIAEKSESRPAESLDEEGSAEWDSGNGDMEENSLNEGGFQITTESTKNPKAVYFDLLEDIMAEGTPSARLRAIRSLGRSMGQDLATAYRMKEGGLVADKADYERRMRHGAEPTPELSARKVAERMYESILRRMEKREHDRVNNVGMTADKTDRETSLMLEDLAKLAWRDVVDESKYTTKTELSKAIRKLSKEVIDDAKANEVVNRLLAKSGGLGMPESVKAKGDALVNTAAHELEKYAGRPVDDWWAVTKKALDPVEAAAGTDDLFGKRGALKQYPNDAAELVARMDAEDVRAAEEASAEKGGGPLTEEEKRLVPKRADSLGLRVKKTLKKPQDVLKILTEVKAPHKEADVAKAKKMLDRKDRRKVANDEMKTVLNEGNLYDQLEAAREQLEAAVGLGDLSENAAYEQAKEDVARLTADIKEQESFLTDRLSPDQRKLYESVKPMHDRAVALKRELDMMIFSDRGKLKREKAAEVIGKGAGGNTKLADAKKAPESLSRSIFPNEGKAKEASPKSKLSDVVRKAAAKKKAEPKANPETPKERLVKAGVKETAKAAAKPQTPKERLVDAGVKPSGGTAAKPSPAGKDVMGTFRNVLANMEAMPVPEESYDARMHQASISRLKRIIADADQTGTVSRSDSDFLIEIVRRGREEQ